MYLKKKIMMALFYWDSSRTLCIFIENISKKKKKQSDTYDFSSIAPKKKKKKTE